MPYYAYDYNIVFVDTTVDPAYKSRTTSKNLASILDANGHQIPQASKILLGKSFPFHIINKNVRDPAGFRGLKSSMLSWKTRTATVSTIPTLTLFLSATRPGSPIRESSRDAVWDAPAERTAEAGGCVQTEIRGRVE